MQKLLLSLFLASSLNASAVPINVGGSSGTSGTAVTISGTISAAQVSGLPTTLPATGGTAATISGTIPATQVSGLPTTLPATGGTAATITGTIPSTQVSGLPTALPAIGGTAATISGTIPSTQVSGLPTTLPATGGTAATISGTLPSSQISGALAASGGTGSGLSLTGTTWIADNSNPGGGMLFFGLNGCQIWSWDTHDANGGEFIFNAPNRIALVPGTNGQGDGGIQMGNNSGTSQWAYFVTNMKTWWNTSVGAAGVFPSVSGSDVELDFWNPYSSPLAVSGGTGEKTVTITKTGLRLGTGRKITFSDSSTQSTTAVTPFAALTDGTAITLDASASLNGTVTLGGNRTLSIINATAGQRGIITVAQDATGGRTLMPPGGSFVPGGVIPLTATPNAVDELFWTYDGAHFHFWTQQGMTLAYDADVLSFIARAGLTDATQKAAVGALVAGLKNANLWSRLYAAYPMVGGNAPAHSQNLISAGPVIVWSGTMTHDSTGATADGASGYGDTQWVPSVSGLQDSMSIAFQSKTQTPTIGGAFWGTQNTSNNNGRFTMTRGGATYLSASGPNNNSVGWQYAPISDFRAFIGLCRTSGSHADYYAGANIQSSDASTSLGLSNDSVYLFARHGGSGPDSYMADTCSFFLIGQGFSQSEMTTLRSLIATYETTLGR